MSTKTTDYIKVYPKAFPVSAISSIIKWCKTQNFESATVIGSKDKDDVTGGGAIAIPKGWLKKIEYLTVSYSEK